MSSDKVILHFLREELALAFFKISSAGGPLRTGRTLPNQIGSNVQTPGRF